MACPSPDVIRPQHLYSCLHPGKYQQRHLYTITAEEAEAQRKEALARRRAREQQNAQEEERYRHEWDDRDAALREREQVEARLQEQLEQETKMALARQAQEKLAREKTDARTIEEREESLRQEWQAGGSLAFTPCRCHPCALPTAMTTIIPRSRAGVETSCPRRGVGACEGTRGAALQRTPGGRASIPSTEC